MTGHFALAAMTWHSPGSIPLALLVIAAVAAAVLWLYPPQLRAVPRPWAWGLPALRLIAFVALALAMLKPVISRPRSESDPGAILILVDRSNSMSVRDSLTGPGAVAEADRASVARQQAARLVALADAMGKLPAARSEPFVELTADAERLRAMPDEIRRAQSEVEYAKLSGRDDTGPDQRLAAATQRLVDAARQLGDRRSELPANSPLAEKLHQIALQAAKPPTNDNLRRFQYMIDDFSRTSGGVQADADFQLYSTDPQVRIACDELGKLSRFQLVEAALTEPGAGLISRLPANAQLYGYGIGDDLTPVPLRGDGQSVRRLLLTPDANRTDLTGGIRKALDSMRGAPVQAVILFSDGRQVGAEAKVTSQLAATGVPTFTVAAAAEVRGGIDGRTILPPPDLSLSHISAPASLFVGEMLTVRADVRCAALESWRKDNPTLNVELEVDGQTQKKPVSLPGGPGVVTATVEFSVKMDHPGASKITLRVPPAPDEVSTENNVASRWVKVLDDKTRIVMVAGSPGWDFRYVRNALTRKPWAQLQDFLLDPRSGKLPLTPEQILQQDLLLLYDVAPGSLDPKQWEAVRQLVEDRGGTVVLMAGEQFLPQQYVNGPIASLLPFQNSSAPTWRIWQGEKPFYHIVPARDAASLDMLKLGDDADQSQQRWNELPPVYRYLELPELKPAVKPLLIERDTQSPVLTESRAGRGRVFFFGFNESWRWRYKVGERDQDRFWLQFLQYAADAPYAITNGNLALDVDPIVAAPDSPIHLRASTSENGGPPTVATSCDVKVMQDGHNIRTVPLAAVGGTGGGRFDGTLDGLPAGDYVIELDGQKPDGSAIAVHYPLHVAEDLESELADLSGDRVLLKSLADASGGEMLPLEQFARLPSQLVAAQERSNRVSDLSLWDSPYLFAFVLACLGLEWSLRKRFGLA